MTAAHPHPLPHLEVGQGQGHRGQGHGGQGHIHVATEVAGDTVAPQTGDLGDDLHPTEAGDGLHLTGGGEAGEAAGPRIGGAPLPTGHHAATAGHRHEVAGTDGKGQGHPVQVQGQGQGHLCDDTDRGRIPDLPGGQRLCNIVGIKQV